MGIGMLHPQLGEVMAITEILVVLTVIAIGLFGSKALSDARSGSFAGLATVPNHRPRTKRAVAELGR